MSARLISADGHETPVIKAEHLALVLRISSSRTDNLHKVERDPLPRTAVRNFQGVSHVHSFRGCFPSATIAEAGEATSLSGGRYLPPDETIIQPYRWYHHLIFCACAFVLIFTMCLLGRPGA